MADLLGLVGAYLDAHDVDAAVIGASALASFGVSRSTYDIDLLVMDRAVLAGSFWMALADVKVEVRGGDADDPLAGVVRCSQPGARPVDIVVGRSRWMQDALASAQHAKRGIGLPVIGRADWVCLKLFAGGMQDLADVAQLRALVGPALDREVSERVQTVPTSLQQRWMSVIAVSD